MITTLRDGKAHLSELVERASRGEDVLITVRGKVKAKLTRVEVTFDAKDRKAWIRELRALQRKHTVSSKTSSEKIFSELREDRV
ncbi:MAG: type II toxin-antitoxin system prevent-host-death family antitoxin [Bryobacterales bacterium]|nr:type II toxin-antitoxin system prevent-host-death family antitoxin [Bryobacterales bacterium]